MEFESRTYCYQNDLDPLVRTDSRRPLWVPTPSSGCDSHSFLILHSNLLPKALLNVLQIQALSPVSSANFPARWETIGMPWLLESYNSCITCLERPSGALKRMASRAKYGRVFAVVQTPMSRGGTYFPFLTAALCSSSINDYPLQQLTPHFPRSLTLGEIRPGHLFCIRPSFSAMSPNVADPAFASNVGSTFKGDLDRDTGTLDDAILETVLSGPNKYRPTNGICLPKS
ncbi:hypothetical protein GALMADRAFT_225929 [Galerina marginata CBS 339.88]|uniref:Uncharacterized protein n=1 Tax=Galerina marginata (strain CBS 339.88) TaxID=685588 RepID=A0A067T8J2_GALM3|nr:hypothetical protein GALMADRAFT_225929 [Galerina marginata CBS 339.88]